MTDLFFQCSKMMVAAAVVLILLARFTGTARETSGDLLAYTDTYFDLSKSLLILYDVDNRLSAPISTTHFDGYMTFSLSADGRLAYASRESGEGEIYVLDTRAADQTPINITQTPAIDESPLAWSPDSRYLAFVVSRSERPQLYVWDGEAAVNITPNDTADSIVSYRAAWSDDGRLAFTVAYGFGVSQNSEIYLWDGKITANLSQNPTGRDDSPVWNADGHIAFLSERDGVYDIYVWDGVSLKDGSPNKDTYANVAPELTDYYSFPTWTPQGQLAFEAQSAPDKRIQIYVWDGQTATNMSQNPTLHNGGASWSADGRWAFVTYFSSKQLLYVRDADNRPILTVEGQYSPAWSPSGFLMFCTLNPRWTLSVWDGQGIISVIQGSHIHATWENNNRVVCSSG